VHRTADGRELLVRHGDDFDLLVRNARWLTRLGDRAIALSRLAGRALDLVRRALRRPPWSLADWLRSRVKRALLYVERFEEAAAAEARRRGLDGIVCGHVHHANLREIQGVLYANDGDWVDSCTALVEDWDGKLSILSLARRPAASVQAASR
jgi:UDP-2,3-diacylglucosamine pyrophosphatase LpxH